MKLKLSTKQRMALESFGTETNMCFVDNILEPFAFIHKRDNTGRRIGIIKFDFAMFNILDFIGVIKYQRELSENFYKYIIKRDYVKKILEE